MLDAQKARPRKATGAHPLSKIIVKYTYLAVCVFLFCILQSIFLDTLPEAQHSAGDSGSVTHEEDPLEKGMATHSVFLPGESHGRRSLVGYSLWVTKSWTHTLPRYYLL